MNNKTTSFFVAANLVIPTLLFLIMLGTYLYTAGKITASMQQNTLAIQNATSQIQINSAEIVNLKMYKAETAVEIKNINTKVNEIFTDVKSLIRQKND